ncbi:DNA-binding domain-containing protein [Eubacterium aggregans]|uniref:DNA-binding domain-containing protein n=1 Tax=Eubacterium aggregans TaxID=81409 RepID=UPI003F344230
MDGLTVKEVATLKGCTERAVRKMIKEGKLETVETKSPANGRLQYLVLVETLPDDLRAKYYASIHAEAPAMPAPSETPKTKGRTEKATKPFEEYSLSEREEIMLWIEMLEAWQRKRNEYANVTEGDKIVVGWLKVTYSPKEHPTMKSLKHWNLDTLYRKWHYYKAGQLDGLLDGRGIWSKGKSSVPQAVLDQFLWYYLDQNQCSVSLCYRSATEAAMEFGPDLVATLPSEHTFRSKIKAEVPQVVLAYLRKGEKACFDAYAPYIERLYDQLEANDVWIADNHTWDIMVKTDDTEVVHRMYITRFLDAKSGVMMGWNVTDNPCSDSTIFALHQGILKHGIPKVCYFDNGT